MRLTEKLITEKLIDHCLEQECTISVNDGEETTLVRSKDRAKILDALCTTELDWVYVYDSAGYLLVSVLLVWGNGTDLISDLAYASSEYKRVTDFMKPVDAFAEELANG